MPTLNEKLARLEEMNRKAQAYLAAGGDPKSDEAVPIWIEYAEASNEVAKEIGYEFLKPIKKRQSDFIGPDPGV
jgi:hypothetical protein